MKPTSIDEEAIELIKTNDGLVHFDLDGNPYLETSSQITLYRVQRLVKLGLLKPSGDSMFGTQSQTYQLTGKT